MTAPLSQDLRQRIVRAVEEGSSIRQAARRFAVSPSAAIKLMQRVRETGSTAPARSAGIAAPCSSLMRMPSGHRRGKAGITLARSRPSCTPGHRGEGALDPPTCSTGSA